MNWINKLLHEINFLTFKIGWCLIREERYNTPRMDLNGNWFRVYQAWNNEVLNETRVVTKWF